MSKRNDNQNLRRERIMGILREEGFVSPENLSGILSVSAVTLRKDLDVMASEGMVRRVSGGAVLPPDGGARGQGRISCYAEKVSIARAVADIVSDGDSLFLNAGTTCLEIARALRSHHSLSIVTTALDVAMLLNEVQGFRVVLLGGELNTDQGFTHGSDAIDQISHYRTDWSVLSIDGISVGGGVTNCHSEEAPVDRVMIANSKRAIIAADHTKIGNAGFFRVCGISDKLMLVTDALADASELEAISSAGAEVVTA